MDFFTKVMHLVATTLYFVYMNKDEKEKGKESETTHSLYNFLENNRCKSLVDKPIKEEDLEEKEGRWHPRFVLFCLMLWFTINSMPFLAFLGVMDINHFINNICNLNYRIILWHSIYIRDNIDDTGIFKTKSFGVKC